MAKRKRSNRPAGRAQTVNRTQAVSKAGMPDPIAVRTPGQVEQMVAAAFPRRAAQGTPDAITSSLAEQGMDNSASMGPGAPLRPYQGYSQPPRINDFPVGVNISTRARETWSRVSFDTLKAIIDAYDVARMCINHKIDEIRSMEPLFIPVEGVTTGADGAVEAARAALEFPDREMPYIEWVSVLLENALRYDALPLYRRRNLGGEIIGLEVIDGTTIAPYIDDHGRRPKPPAPAYYQIIKGQPWNWYTSQDIDYRRFRPQGDSPYGLAPMESLLLTANTDLRFQWHFMQMFTDGSIPAGFIELPPDISSPDQVAEWQDYWDAMVLGDQAKLHQLIAVPNGTKINQFRPENFDSAFPEYLMTRTCAAFGVVPQDLGLVKDVNRANGETQVDVQFRVNTLPWVLWIQGILSRYLQRGLGLPIKVMLDTGRDKEDRLAEAQAWREYINSGMASPDEGRQELLGLPVDHERPVPRGILTARQGFVPLVSMEAIAGPIDPETAAPRDDVPLPTVPFGGTPGLVADKLPGGAEFKRASINPDEPRFPELEQPVPGTDVVAKPVAKEATAGVTSDTGIVGVDLVGVDVADEDEEPDPVVVEKAAFGRFVKARRKGGKWRDFTFTALDRTEAHRLNDEGRATVRKAAGELVAAGLCVQAADTGRVLMLQRALDPTDPAGGCWEFPGGHIEDGESPLAAACREWQEETGCLLPVDAFTQCDVEGLDTWTSPNGIYGGFVLSVPSESLIDLGGRGQVNNPDDPDGDVVEAIAWFDPAHLSGNPALRPELAADLALVHNALGVGEVVKGNPKASWRDNPADTPQTAFDLRLTDHYAPLITEALRGMFSDAQLRAAAGAVVKAAAPMPEPDPGELERVIDEMLREAYIAGGHAAGAQVGPGAVLIDTYISQVDWSSWAPGDLTAAAFAADGGLAALLADADVTIRGIIDATLEQLGNRIADGVAAGLSVDEIAASLGDLLDDPSRAEMIAHTETARAMTASSLATYDANGLAQWDLITSGGACPICLDIAAANPHAVGDTADAAPVHPRCRCSVAPTIPPDWLPPDEGVLP